MRRRDPQGPVRSRSSSLVRHFSGRVDALTSAVLVFPLFLTYQLGILTGRGQNGVDFITRSLIELSHRDVENYLLILGGAVIAYLAVVVVLARRDTFTPQAFVPTLIESSFYALAMGSIIVFAMNEFLGILPQLAM